MNTTEAIDRNVSECLDRVDEYDAVRKQVHQLRRAGHIDDRTHTLMVAAIGTQIEYWLAEAEKYKAMRPAPIYPDEDVQAP